MSFQKFLAKLKRTLKANGDRFENRNGLLRVGEMCPISYTKQQSSDNFEAVAKELGLRRTTMYYVVNAADDYYEKKSLRTKWYRKQLLKTLGLASLLLMLATPTFAQADGFNLSQATIHWSPSDVASWPITDNIRRVTMSGAGLHFDFTTDLPDRWKLLLGPNGDNFQYTVWACEAPEHTNDGKWHCAGFIQMWQGKPATGAPILTDFHTNWAYAADRWGTLQAYFPMPGDRMGFFVSAGNARGEAGVTSVRERSNVVIVPLPLNDTGVYVYADKPPLVDPPPDVAPPTTVPPVVDVPAPQPVPVPTPNEPPPQPPVVSVPVVVAPVQVVVPPIPLWKTILTGVLIAVLTAIGINLGIGK